MPAIWGLVNDETAGGTNTSVVDFNAQTVGAYRFNSSQYERLQSLYPVNASYFDPSHGGVVRDRARSRALTSPVLQGRQRGRPPDARPRRAGRLVQRALSSLLRPLIAQDRLFAKAMCAARDWQR